MTWLASRVLGLLVRDDELRTAILGDLEEEATARRILRGNLSAQAWIWSQVIRSVPYLVLMPTPHSESEMSTIFSWQDLRGALRRLSRAPVFAALTVVVLGGGLAVSIFTFSFLHTAALKPLPLPSGDRIVRLEMAGTNGSSSTLDAADVAAMRESITRLTDVGIFTSKSLVVGEGSGSWTLDATATEFTMFAATGTRPLLGRSFTADDQRVGAAPAVILSYATWRNRFEGNRAVIGEFVKLNGVRTRIVGIMPSGFGFPVAAEGWVPVDEQLLRETTFGARSVEAFGRIAPGANMAQASAELTTQLQRVRFDRPRATTPAQDGPTRMRVATFPMSQLGDDGPLFLTVLNVLAGLILLLACVNVTNLLLARANEQQRETAVRLALGAPRGRLILQSMWESILLCVGGGALATVIAAWALSTINSWAYANLEGNLAFWWVWGFDRTVVLSAGAFVTLAIMALGVVVSRHAVTTEINAILQDGASRAGSRREGRVARVLVAVQVGAVSLIMFIGTMSGIVAYRVANVDVGYDTKNLLTAAVDPARRSDSSLAAAAFLQVAYDRLAARPELDGVVFRTTLADRQDAAGRFEMSGARPTVPAQSNVMAYHGSLNTLGIALVQGRYLDDRDREGAEPTAVVSAAFAAQYSPGRSPIGELIRLAGQEDSLTWRTIVGVVGDVLIGNPLSRNRSAVAVYVPLRQAPVHPVRAIFRHRGSEPAGRWAWHEAMGGLSQNGDASPVQSFEEVLSKTTLLAKSVATLFGACFVFALLLAVSGTYGLMARSIGRRTKEIGVRRALGATDAAVLRHLLGQSGRQVGVGALIVLPLTLPVAFAASRLFPIDLSAAVGVAVAVTGSIVMVVMGATWFPTQRAIRIDPRDALWREH